MTQAEENYLKAIFSLEYNSYKNINTNLIATKLNTKASSVTDMLKKLADKNLVIYRKYKGVKLSGEGYKIAINVVRKHRLWECFLVDKLNFSWDNVHEIAEQLEHIKSAALMEKLDAFLGYPKKDPHGDIIPDKDGNIDMVGATLTLDKLPKKENGIFIGVKDSSDIFLQYLNKIELALGDNLYVVNRELFDNSVVVNKGIKELHFTEMVAKNIIIEKL